MECLAIGMIGLAAVSLLIRKSFDPAHQSAGRMAGRRDGRRTGDRPFVIAGLSLIAESGGGLYWVLAGIVGAILGGVTNAWVLLVEILR